MLTRAFDSPNQTAQRTVLIVDDAPIIADTLALIFVTAGYDASVARSAEEALEQAQSRDFDLAVIDVILPQMHGIDLAIHLQQKDPKCRFLLLSGLPLTADDLLSAKAKEHCFDVLAKPIHPSELLRLVGRSLAGA